MLLQLGNPQGGTVVILDDVAALDHDEFRETIREALFLLRETAEVWKEWGREVETLEERDQRELVERNQKLERERIRRANDALEAMLAVEDAKKT